MNILKNIILSSLVFSGTFVFADQLGKFQASCEQLLRDRKITYRELDEPVISNYWEKEEERFEKYEMAEIILVNDPLLQGMIDFVKLNDGEVRLMKTRVLTGTDMTFKGWQNESPYFWVNTDPNSKSYLIPVIGIDLNRGRAVASLAHEIEHFKIWLGAYKAGLASGLSKDAAAKAAVKYVWREDMIVYGERKAVEAEMNAEREFPDHPFNQASEPRPTEFWEEGYVNRITYPEFQAVRRILFKLVGKNRQPPAALSKYLKDMIILALKTKSKAVRHEAVTANPQLQKYWKQTSVKKLLFEPYGKDRLEIDGSLELFEKYLRKTCLELTFNFEQCG